MPDNAIFANSRKLPFFMINCSPRGIKSNFLGDEPMKYVCVISLLLLYNYTAMTDEISPAEYAAVKIQTAFRAYQLKQTTTYQAFKFYIISSIPYNTYRDMICKNQITSDNDLFLKYLHYAASNPEEILADAKLQHRYKKNYEQACYEIFIDRAINEIESKRLTWQQAVSNNDESKYKTVHLPTQTVQYARTIKPQQYPILGEIFNHLAEKLAPQAINVLLTTMPPTISYYYDDGLSIIYSIFGHTYTRTISFDVTQDDNKINSDEYKINISKELLTEELSSCLDDYLKQLGLPAHLFSFDDYDSQINWHLCASRIFQLGRLFFDNQTDAIIELGGQQWLKQQPKDVQMIINQHLQTIKDQQNSRPTTSWLKKLKKNIEYLF